MAIERDTAIDRARNIALVRASGKERIIVRRLILLGMLTFMIILTNTNLFPWTNNLYFIYLVRPLLWLSIALTVYRFPRVRAVGRLSLRRFIINLAIGSAVVNILFMMVGGMITGLGKSPYAFGPVTSTVNFLYIGSFVLGLEAARAYLINSYKGKRNLWIIALVGFFCVFTELSLREFQNLTTTYAVIKYLGSTFGPALALSLLTTYLAYLGGFVPAAIFHGIIILFEWFSPILPDLTWPMKTFLGCFIPTFTLLFVRHLYFLQARLIKRTSTESEQLLGWLVTSIISVALIWFAVGLFPLYPSVIVTGSMEPLIKPGDIVLVQKIAGEEAQVGDIIQFYEPERELNITHRVIEVNQEGTPCLFTKGDNNSFADSDPVSMAQVKGKVIKVIPKAGWFTLFLRSNQPIPEDVLN